MNDFSVQIKAKWDVRWGVYPSENRKHSLTCSRQRLDIIENDIDVRLDKLESYSQIYVTSTFEKQTMTIIKRALCLWWRYFKFLQLYTWQIWNKRNMIVMIVMKPRRLIVKRPPTYELRRGIVAMRRSTGSVSATHSKSGGDTGTEDRHPQGSRVPYVK